MTGDFRRQIEMDIRSDLDPVAAAADFADRVRRDLAAAISRGEVPGRYARFVDGREGASENAVKPGGTIVYEFSYGVEIVAFALAFLRARSPTGPIGSGPKPVRRPFSASFWISIDGKFIEAGNINWSRIPDGAEYIIGNLQPYARKLDVQLIGKRQLHFNRPPGLYADAAREINRRFGNFVSAKRVYSIDFPGRYRLRQTQMRTGEESHRVKRHIGEPVESPALVITPR